MRAILASETLKVPEGVTVRVKKRWKFIEYREGFK